MLAFLQASRLGPQLAALLCMPCTALGQLPFADMAGTVAAMLSGLVLNTEWCWYVGYLDFCACTENCLSSHLQLYIAICGFCVPQCAWVPTLLCGPI